MRAPSVCRACSTPLPAGAEVCGNCGARIIPVTLPGAVADVDYAGFWIRAIASVVDAIILNIIGLLIGLAIESQVWRLIIVILIGMTYDVGFWVANDGATPGKVAAGIRVQMADGQPMEVGPALLRCVGYAASTIVLFFGFIMIGLTPEKRGLHDYIAGTVVVRTRF